MLPRARAGARWRAPIFLCAFLFSSAVSAAQEAAPYSRLFVFGDSLTDSGNAFLGTSNVPFISPIPGPPYFNGRFSNGYNFADQLNQRLFGQPLTPSAAGAGGSDFAVGGATTGDGNNAVPQLPTGMRIQRDVFLQTRPGGNADPTALYLVYGGSNDVFGAVDQFEQNPSDPAGIRAQMVSTAMGNLNDIIGSLAAKGARHFLIPNLPDLGKTPRFLGNAADSSFASAASVEFNDALDDLLAQYATLDIRRLDVFDAFNRARSGEGGFADTTGACYTGPLTGGAPAPCSNPDAFLFWDEIHPSARTHALLGGLAYAAAVPEPQTWALLLVGLILLGGAARRAVRVSA